MKQESHLIPFGRITDLIGVEGDIIEKILVEGDIIEKILKSISLLILKLFGSFVIFSTFEKSV